MRIDSHQHFWCYSAEEYPWMQPEGPIRRNYLPDDIAPELRACAAREEQQFADEFRREHRTGGSP